MHRINDTFEVICPTVRVKKRKLLILRAYHDFTVTKS